MLKILIKNLQSFNFKLNVVSRIFSNLYYYKCNVWVNRNDEIFKGLHNNKYYGICEVFSQHYTFIDV